jgi:hypothetical protein
MRLDDMEVPKMNTAKRRAVPIGWLEGRATAAVTCGAVGLFMFNIVLGPIAIALGASALRRDETGRLGRLAALLGIVLGVADLVVLAVLVAMNIHDGTFGWHLR